MRARGYIVISIAIHTITLPYAYYISDLSNSSSKQSATSAPSVFFPSKASKLSTEDFEMLRDGWGFPSPLLYESDQRPSSIRNNSEFYKSFDKACRNKKECSSFDNIPIIHSNSDISYIHDEDIDFINNSIQDLSLQENNSNMAPFSIYISYNYNTYRIHLSDQNKLADIEYQDLVKCLRQCYKSASKEKMNQLSNSTLINLSTIYMRLKSTHPSGYLATSSESFKDQRTWHSGCNKSTLNLFLTGLFVPPSTDKTAKNPYFNNEQIQKLNALNQQLLTQLGNSLLQNENLHFYRLILAVQNLETVRCHGEKRPRVDYQLALTYNHLLSILESKSNKTDFMFGLIKDNYIGMAIKSPTLEESVDLLESAIRNLPNKELSKCDENLYFSLLKELFLVQLQFGVRSANFSNEQLLASLLELVPEPANNPYYKSKQEENRPFDLFIQLYQLDIDSKESEASRNQKRCQIYQENANSELKTKIFSEYAHMHVSALQKQLRSLPNTLERLQFVRSYESQADFMQFSKAADVRLAQALPTLERPILTLSALPFSQFFFYTHILISSLITLYYSYMVALWTRNTFKNNYK